MLVGMRSHPPITSFTVPVWAHQHLCLKTEAGINQQEHAHEGPSTETAQRKSHGVGEKLVTDSRKQHTDPDQGAEVG